ncbi:MAG: hypothetical protein ACR2OW_09125 [Methyloligellaceae bacterium]
MKKKRTAPGWFGGGALFTMGEQRRHGLDRRCLGHKGLAGGMERLAVPV